jgi:tRNA threonylcarbamoyl adenosine modification protein (Sua5/YciO/YrdC/YwlC family)
MKSIQAHHPDAIPMAAKVIRNGGMIIYPTDTVYGFGVDATNDDAIEKLNSIKNREGPMSIVAPDIDTVKSWITTDSKVWESIKNKLGGKTTVILPVREGVVSALLLGKNQTLGIRIPNHAFPTGLVHTLGFPITTTSVNRTGEPAYHNPEMIEQSFEDEIDLIVDDGVLSTMGSAIYLFKNNSFTTIRS